MRTDSASALRIEKYKKVLSDNQWLKEWKDNMRQMINICKDNNINCYLLDHASLVYKDAPWEAKIFANKDLNLCDRFDIYVDYLDIIRKATLELCDKTDAKFIPVSQGFDKYSSNGNKEIDYKKRFLLFNDRMHFTNEGNYLLADLIYQKIKGDL